MTNIMLNEMTMSSREIAELTGKQHSHVLRDIRSMLKDVEHNPELDSGCKSTTYTASTGQQYNQYELNKDFTLTLLLGYDVKARLKVVKRWQELEQQVAIPQLPDFTNPVEAARAWADEVELKLIAEAKLEEQKPKVEFYDHLADKTTLLTATQVGKMVGMSGTALNRRLDAMGVYSKSVSRARVLNAWWMEKGYGEIKITGAGYTQSLFTQKGLQHIQSLFSESEKDIELIA